MIACQRTILTIFQRDFIFSFLLASFFTFYEAVSARLIDILMKHISERVQYTFCTDAGPWPGVKVEGSQLKFEGGKFFVFIVLYV